MALESVSALILDDNAHMRGLLRAILTNFGMRQIEEAEQFEDAATVLAAGEVDLAFVDIKLEGPNGIAFCRHVRRIPGGQARFLPLIVVTAYSERSRVIEAVNAGVDEFLVKPVRPVDVANRVNAVIERRRSFIDIPTYFGPDRRRRVDPRFTGPWRRSHDPGTLDI